MRGIFKIVIILVTAFVLLTQLATAAELNIAVSPETATQGAQIIVTVTVTQDSGTPTPVENVFLQFTIDEGTPIYAVTNASGQAVFTPEIAGTLKIVAMKDGLMNSCKYITVTSPAPTPTPPGGGDGGDGTSYWWSGSVTLPSGTFTKTTFDTGKTYTLNWQTALGALQRASEVGGFAYEIEETSWGPFVYSIAGKKTGDEGATSGWMYQVNGESPMVGAHEYSVSIGDEVIWYFSKSMDTTPSTSSMVLKIKIASSGVSGGGGGVSPTPTPTPAPTELVEERKEIELIEAGGNASLTFERIDVTRIIINAANTIRNAEVTIQQIEKPANTADVSGMAYYYFNVTTTNVTDANMTTATIEFKVNKSWLNASDIDEATIALSRYSDINNNWTALPTSKIGEDNTSVYFESKTPGFSLFAISGKERTTTAPPSASAPYAAGTPPPAITPTSAPESTAAAASAGMERVVMITVGIVLLLIVLIGYFTLKREGR